MTPEEQAQLKSLLTDQRVLTLAVLVDTAPLTGLLPFAAVSDFSALLVHASKLARHTAGLLPGAPFSLMIHTPDAPELDPLQIPRVTLQGNVQVLAKGSADYTAAREAYLAKFPSSQPIFSLGDFNLYELTVNDGRFVAGFGRAYNLTADTLRKLAT